MKCLICCEWLSHGVFIPSFVFSNFLTPARVGAVKQAKLIIMEQGMARRLFCPAQLFDVHNSPWHDTRGREYKQGIGTRTQRQTYLTCCDITVENMEAKVRTRCQRSRQRHLSLALFPLKSHSIAIVNTNIISSLFTAAHSKRCCVSTFFFSYYFTIGFPKYCSPKKNP